MSKFRVAKSVDPAKLDAFVEGAGRPAVQAVAPAPAANPAAAPRADNEHPWENFAPDALPKTGINLRLNDYEHQALKWLAERDDRSLQYTLKRLLKQALETELPR
ncbi:MAG: hypothetical protein M0T84_13495 [Betaproteobacteria bacterium]|nr:hypothetical protein [Betaproteobacteria bacterium]